jgi:ATP-binding cassette subfamily B protein
MVVNYTNILFRPLENITSQLEDLQGASASIERLNELYHTPTNLTDGHDPDLPVGPLGLAFNNVDFGYNAGEPVLEKVSFALQPGQVLGLLGRTGSGKSTIGRLLFRLYDIDQGEIVLDNGDIRQRRIEDVRQRVGMVTQTVQLFRGSLRDNLSFFGSQIADEKMREVIDLMGLEDWYRTLPNGLDTELESNGKGLSAGEAQLLTFARVFLQEPGLVVLDEASSRLDPVTESRIERAVDRLLAQRTGIIIAHRLATVQRADQILILEEGRVAEYGERAVLEKDPASRFSGLVKTGLAEVLA